MVKKCNENQLCLLAEGVNKKILLLSLKDQVIHDLQDIKLKLELYSKPEKENLGELEGKVVR